MQCILIDIDAQNISNGTVYLHMITCAYEYLNFVCILHDTCFGIGNTSSRMWHLIACELFLFISSLSR